MEERGHFGKRLKTIRAMVLGVSDFQFLLICSEVKALGIYASQKAMGCYHSALGVGGQ